MTGAESWLRDRSRELGSAAGARKGSAAGARKGSAAGARVVCWLERERIAAQFRLDPVAPLSRPWSYATPGLPLPIATVAGIRFGSDLFGNQDAIRFG